MTEFSHLVERQKLLLEAQVWAKQTKTLHAHRLKSMWYDNRPQDTDDGYVIDVQYNSGLIERTLSNGTKVVFGKRLDEEELLYAYTHQH